MHGQPVNTPPRSRQSTSTPTDVAVNLAPPHPVVILCPSCWRSYLPLPAQLSSSSPLDGVHINSSTPCSHIQPCSPSGHPLPHLLAVTFIPPYPQINTNPEASQQSQILQFLCASVHAILPFFSVSDPHKFYADPDPGPRKCPYRSGSRKNTTGN